MTQIQELISCGVPKFTNGYEELCMTGAKFLKEIQVREKIIGVNFFPIHIQPFMNGYEGLCMRGGSF